MSHIDYLTDGTQIVNLATNANNAFAQISGSYKQKITELDPLGRYPLVWEEWALNWSATVDDQRGDLHVILMNFKRQAKQWANRLWRDPPVWRVTKTPTEDQPRYSFVHDLQIPELSPQFYEPGQRTKRVLIRVLRDGVWRGDDPAASVLAGGDGSTWIGSPQVAVYDYQVGLNTNALTIAPNAGGFSGDAESLVKLKLDYGVFSPIEDQNLIIGRKSGTLAELDPFNSQFNPIDAALIPDPPILPILVLDPNIAGGSRIDVANGVPGVAEVGVQWPINNMVAYQGNYLAYAQVRVVTNTGLILQFAQGFGIGADYVGIDKVDISNMTSAMSWRYAFLGLASLPAYGSIPRGITQAGSYNIRLTIFIPQGSSIQIGKLFLVPVDEGVFSVRNIQAAGGTTGLLINGDLPVTYPIIASNGNITSLPVDPNGRYLTAAFDRYTRLYFFKSGPPTLGYDAAYYGLSATLIQPFVIPRLKALRNSS